VTARGTVFGALALALASGCMTIYPDPELPDVVVEWFPDDTCTEGVTGVRVEILGDATTTPIAQDFPCAGGIGRIEDIARTRHDVQVALLDDTDTIVGRSEPFDIDLRNGASHRERVFWFYRDEGLIAIAWRFAGGESCASLGITTLQVNAYPEDTTLGQAGFGARCDLGELDYYPGLFAGTYDFQVVGMTDQTGEVVAASMWITDQVVRDRGELTDLGTVELARCPPCDLEPPDQDSPPPPPRSPPPRSPPPQSLEELP
jgi:hypothetical protein